MSSVDRLSMRVALGAFVVLFVSGILLIANTLPREPYHPPSCANQMRQMGFALRMYASESEGGIYPPLHPTPGRLMWHESMVPEYLPDPLVTVCPDGPDWKSSLEIWKDRYSSQKELLSRLVDDVSYFYLGYAMFSDNDVERFAEFYRARVEAGSPVNSDIPSFSDDEKEGYSILRLHTGIAEEFLSDPNRRLSPLLESALPVMIERPGNHEEPGGHVLYLDGHVEFVEYPGKWPMTGKTIGLLLELDALGER